MIDVDLYGKKIIERYDEGTDLFGYQYIKFAIATFTNPRVMRWTLFINPNEIVKKKNTQVNKELSLYVNGMT